MCRLAAYMGPDLLLHRLLQDPSHSLIEQSWAPEEMDEAKLNADGFGFGWYTADKQPAIYTNTLPIWSDINLAGLGQSLRSRIWLANVRSATPGQALSQTNTQPFLYKHYLYLHNGYLEGFSHGLKQNFFEHLSPEIQAEIQGNTDSEYIFALFKQSLRKLNGSAEQALLEALQTLDNLLNGAKGLINLIICDGKQIIACRHATNGGACPSLYYSTAHPDYPNASLLASERFASPEHWQEIAEHSILILSPENPVRSVSI